MEQKGRVSPRAHAPARHRREKLPELEEGSAETFKTEVTEENKDKNNKMETKSPRAVVSKGITVV